MGKFDDLINLYETEMKEKMGVRKPDSDLLRKVAKACGPALYRKDATKVAISDKTEMARVKKNFLANRLGITDEAKQDKAIAKAIEKIGKSNRNKYRAIFYYFLTKETKKSSVFAD